MPNTDSISRDFKRVFAADGGKQVLECLKTICYANHNQTCYAEDSDRRTYMRLGANSVYRHIMMQIEKELGKPEVTECQTERTENEH
jgi:hypothetical protein